MGLGRKMLVAEEERKVVHRKQPGVAVVEEAARHRATVQAEQRTIVEPFRRLHSKVVANTVQACKAHFPVLCACKNVQCSSAIMSVARDVKRILKKKNSR